MIDRNTEAPNDAKPVLCAGAVSKDGISLIHGDSLQAQLSAAFAICCRNIVCLYLGLNSLKNLW